jgi:hypothetical protein
MNLTEATVANRNVCGSRVSHELAPALVGTALSTHFPTVPSPLNPAVT